MNKMQTETTAFSLSRKMLSLCEREKNEYNMLKEEINSNIEILNSRVIRTLEKDHSLFNVFKRVGALEQEKIQLFKTYNSLTNEEKTAFWEETLPIDKERATTITQTLDDFLDKCSFDKKMDEDSKYAFSASIFYLMLFPNAQDLLSMITERLTSGDCKFIIDLQNRTGIESIGESHKVDQSDQTKKLYSLSRKGIFYDIFSNEYNQLEESIKDQFENLHAYKVAKFHIEKNRLGNSLSHIDIYYTPNSEAPFYLQQPHRVIYHELGHAAREFFGVIQDEIKFDTIISSSSMPNLSALSNIYSGEFEELVNINLTTYSENFLDTSQPERITHKGGELKVDLYNNLQCAISPETNLLAIYALTHTQKEFGIKFFEEVKKGNIDLVDQILSDIEFSLHYVGIGIRVNCFNYALKNNNVEMLDTLLKYKTYESSLEKISITQQKMDQLLLLAVSKRANCLCEYLLRRGANITTKNEKNRDALDLMIDSNNITLARSIFKGSEHTKILDERLLKAAKAYDENKVLFLLKCGVKPTATDTTRTSNGWNALHWAVRHGNITLVNAIIKSDPNAINSQTSAGYSLGFFGGNGKQTPLILAAMYRKEIGEKASNAIIQALIDNGARSDIIDQKGYTYEYYLPKTKPTSENIAKI